MSKIEEEISFHCSSFLMIKANPVITNNLISKVISNSSFETYNFSKFDQVKINDITDNEGVFENDNDDEVSTRVVENSKEYYKLLNENGQHYFEKKIVVYPNFKDFPNQVFVTKGNYDKIDQRFISMVNKDNMKVTYAGLYST